MFVAFALAACAAVPVAQAAELPDGRAYEQVTPVDKHGADALVRLGWNQAAEDGDAAVFFFDAGIPGGTGAQDFTAFLADRGTEPEGWFTQGIYPPATYGQEAGVLGWSPDLKLTLDEAYLLDGFLNGNPPHLYARDNVDGSLRLVATMGSSIWTGFSFAGVSSDDSLVVFEGPPELEGTSTVWEGTSGTATAKQNVWIWNRSTGALGLVSVDPAGQAMDANTTVGPQEASTYYDRLDSHGVSSDGSRVFFTEVESGQLYVRVNPAATQSPVNADGECLEPALACTYRVSASRKTNGTGPSGTDYDGPRPASFQEATRDGSYAFFTSAEELTNDANTGPAPSVGRASINGGPTAGFLSVPAVGVAVDAGHIYWTDPKAGAIGRAKLDGSNPEPNFITGASEPEGVAVNSEHVYWTNAATGTIGRAEIGGGEPEQEFITGASHPEGIAVNSEYVYWANSGSKKIGRAELDGGNPSQSFVGVTCSPRSKCTDTPVGVAVDGSHIYWSNPYKNEIGRATIAGASPKQEFIYPTAGANEPEGVASDGEHVYWVNHGTDTVGRAKSGAAALGEEIEPSFITGAAGAAGIATDGEHVYLAQNTGDRGDDLYRYDARNRSLTDLTPDPADTDGAEVLGVLGSSEDGSYVYFAANGVLASNVNENGEEAEPGNCPKEEANCNLYLWHAGEVTFVSELDYGSRAYYTDGADWGYIQHGSSGIKYGKTSRVSSDGTLLFRSIRRLTSYDNQEEAEFYRYSPEGTGKLDCVSCNPDGSAPTYSGGIEHMTSLQASVNGSFPSSNHAIVLPRNLSADGDRVFFNSPEPLVAADTDGVEDVYEWEAPGSGSCVEASAAFSTQDGGCLYLLSSGQDPLSSTFFDASISGSDAFFETTSSLVGQDGDQATDVYDARVGGGMASQNQPLPTACGGEEACRGAATATAAAQAPATSSFAGSGNVSGSGQAVRPKHCPKGKRKVRRRGKVRCVDKRPRQPRRTRHRRAHHDRRAGR